MQQFKDILLKDFIKALQSAGGEVFFVGGSVRDYFLNKVPKDIDIAVRLLQYDTIVNILNDFGKVDVVGKSFGVIKFKNNDNFEVEISLPRIDIIDPNSKGHKAIIAQSNPELPITHDLYRRDFTINSIAIDQNLNVIDPYGGLRDIDCKMLKATNPNAFTDDPLRMLRAVQFAARFGFDIEINTLQAIQTKSYLIRTITSERILMEFEKVFDKAGDVKQFGFMLSETKLFENIFNQNLVFTSLLQLNLLFSLPEFLFDQFLNNFKNESMIPFLKNKLKIDNETVKKIKAMEVFCNGNKSINQICFDALQFYPKIYELNIYKEHFTNFLDKKYPKSYNELPLTGDQLIEMGYEEGTKIGDIRKKLLNEILSDNLPNNYEACFEFVKANF